MKICRFLGTKVVISKYYLSKTSDNTDAMATTKNEDKQQVFITFYFSKCPQILLKQV